MATGAPAQTMLRKAVVRADVDQRIQVIGQEAQAEPESVVGRPTGGRVPADPFASLRGVAGWAVDHVAFLREPIDRLENDPGSVQATVDALRAAAERMRELARGQREVLARPEGWTGTAADAYRASMDKLGEELGSLAEAVAVKGVVVENTGAMVQALREAVLHTVGQYSDSLVPGAIQAYVFAPVTFGASIAVFLGSVVGSATQLGSSIAAKVDDLNAALTRQVDRVKQLDGISDDIGREWERFESAAGGETAAMTARTASRPLVPERGTEALRPMHALAREHEALRPMQATAREFEAVQPTRAVAREYEALQPMRAVAAEHETWQPMRVAAEEPVQARHAVRAEPMVQAMRVEAPVHHEAQPMMRATEPVTAYRLAEHRVAEHGVAEPLQARAVTATHEATVRRVEATD
ncbi:hypothetical protein FHX81_7367 [Saccharothrix saharensis]|uniref:Uncharacterized protein n=1 Tax=Saccharothrix saharensis TaxID=571190 RepID=A0A543JPZ9_9PSEU|nr:hypothetical protein [Saccharothrix saharensis]TQM84903.1 hypothetical protein FHX81_7367 [Saccharothrix saharensis]